MNLFLESQLWCIRCLEKKECSCLCPPVFTDSNKTLCLWTVTFSYCLSRSAFIPLGKTKRLSRFIQVSGWAGLSRALADPSLSTWQPCGSLSPCWAEQKQQGTHTRMECGCDHAFPSLPRKPMGWQQLLHFRQRASILSATFFPNPLLEALMMCITWFLQLL